MKAKSMSELEKIEQFIRDNGSDSVGVFGGSHEGGVQLQHMPDEFAECILEILQSGKTIRGYLEIGSAAGGTAFHINHFIKPKAMVLVDDNTHGKAHLRTTILGDIYHIEVFPSPNAASLISETPQPIDLLMIDGIHEYPNVRGDVDTYGPLLESGGYMILHDTLFPWWGAGDVVKELKKDKRWEFIREYASEKHTSPCGTALFRKVANEKSK